MRLRDARWHVAAVIASAGLGVAGIAGPASAAERALELVTPPGSVPDVKWGGGASTPDGNVVCFNTELMIAGAPSNGNVTADDGFCATRAASGWETEWVTGPAPDGELRGVYGSQIYYVSDDGRRVVFASDAGIFPDFTGLVGTTVSATLSGFMYEAGETRWLAPTPEPIREERSASLPQMKREPLAASKDLRYGMFASIIRLLPEDQNSELDVYAWTPTGIQLVSRDETGAAVGGLPAITTERAEQRQAQPGSVSDDGSRMFFERRGTALAGAPANVRSVFMLEGDELTHVSPRLAPTRNADVMFLGSYRNGTIVYLQTRQQLTDDPIPAGDAIYRYDVENRALRLVVAGGTLVFLDASQDGETIVYTRGAGPELHVRRGADDWHLYSLNPILDTQYQYDSVAGRRSDKRALRLSADGSTLVFAAWDPLDMVDPFSMRQRVYRWTAAGGLRTISVASDGSPATEDATLGNFMAAYPNPLGMERPRYTSSTGMRKAPSLGRGMSEDGSRVFFDTRSALVPEDVNGRVDVYEWRGGSVQLVSPGTQKDDAFYHDNSADGRTVFFVTPSRLIPELDRNTARDLYAAREGGGFPLPADKPECVEDGCQPPARSPPTLPRGTTSLFEGPGDVVEPEPATARVTIAKVTRRQRRAFARRGAVVLRLRTNVRGVVRATAKARIRRRNVRVARTTRAVRDNASIRLRLPLSRSARRVLRTRGRLRIGITIAHSESDTPVRRVVVLRGA